MSEETYRHSASRLNVSRSKGLPHMVVDGMVRSILQVPGALMVMNMELCRQQAVPLVN